MCVRALDPAPHMTPRCCCCAQGVLSDQYVIDNVAALFSTLRTCNVTLRWLLLHRKTAHRKCVDCVTLRGGGAAGCDALLVLTLCQVL